jgi:hypothetical protein
MNRYGLDEVTRASTSGFTLAVGVSDWSPPQLGGAVLAAKRRVRHANATARLTTKPPLCQECAKTGKHSPTIRGQSGHEPAAELGIPRRYGTV